MALVASLTGEVFVASVALLGVLVTAMVTYLGTRKRLLDDLARDYDLELRSNRVAVYPSLWELSSPGTFLEKHGGVVTISELTVLSESLRLWYFEKGGVSV
jgi:hypothetical protein